MLELFNSLVGQTSDPLIFAVCSSGVLILLLDITHNLFGAVFEIFKK